MKRRIAIMAFFALLLSLLGCAAPDSTISTAPQTTTSSVAPTDTDWPAAVTEDMQLFRPFQYNGSLKVNWNAPQADATRKQIIWLSDPENNQFFIKSLDAAQFYANTFWIRLELTEAGRHYCDEGWTVAMQARMSPERGGSLRDPIESMMVIPYYDAEDHATLAGWIICGRIQSSVPVQLELAGEAGRQTHNAWLAPSVANTYIDQDLFTVTKIREALEITEVSKTLRSVQWEEKTYYFAATEQGMPETAVDWFLVVPRQDFLQSEAVRELSVNVYTPVHGPGNPFQFRFTGTIGLYADPELTELAMIYVYNGEEFTDHLYLSLYWTDQEGANQCTKVVTYTPGMRRNQN